MRIYIIGNDGITLCREALATVNDGEVMVASQEELYAAPLSGKRLLALWNALPGVEKRRTVGDRRALISKRSSISRITTRPTARPAWRTGWNPPVGHRDPRLSLSRGKSCLPGIFSVHPRAPLRLVRHQAFELAGRKFKICNRQSVRGCRDLGRVCSTSASSSIS